MTLKEQKKKKEKKIEQNHAKAISIFDYNYVRRENLFNLLKRIRFQSFSILNINVQVNFSFSKNKSKKKSNAEFLIISSTLATRKSWLVMS